MRVGECQCVDSHDTLDKCRFLSVNDQHEVVTGRILIGLVMECHAEECQFLRVVIKVDSWTTVNDEY